MSQAHTQGEEGLGAPSPPGDKRRNKLGYQRTSVACGHCRRRKIRCLLPSPEDPLGRCANCIRLKKECTFFPVDHTPEGSKRTTTSSSTESPSGPLTPSHLPDGHSSSEYDPSNSSDHYGGLSYSSSRSLSLPYGLATSHLPIHSGYGIAAVSEGEEWTQPWIHSGPSQQSQQSRQSNSTVMNEHASPYWHSEASTPSHTNFPHDSYDTASMSYQLPEQQSQQQQWLGNRSYSYGHLESLQHQQHYTGSYPGPSNQMPDGMQYGQGSPSGDGHHGLQSPYQVSNPHSPFGTPWFPSNRDNTGSSHHWVAEPHSTLPSESNEGEQYGEEAYSPPTTARS